MPSPPSPPTPTDSSTIPTRSACASARCSPTTAGSRPSIASRAPTTTPSTCCTSRPCRRLSVVALVWLPGQSTPIHDHVSWCVVGVYAGRERETRYRAVEVGGERWLEPVGEVDARPGHVEVIVPSVEDIHRVTAAGDGPTVSIHVYGADIERLGSSIYRRFDDWTVLSGPSAARTADVSVSMS